MYPADVVQHSATVPCRESFARTPKAGEHLMRPRCWCPRIQETTCATHTRDWTDWNGGGICWHFSVSASVVFLSSEPPNPTGEVYPPPLRCLGKKTKTGMCGHYLFFFVFCSAVLRGGRVRKQTKRSSEILKSNEKAPCGTLEPLGAFRRPCGALERG